MQTATAFELCIGDVSSLSLGVRRRGLDVVLMAVWTDVWERDRTQSVYDSLSLEFSAWEQLDCLTESLRWAPPHWDAIVLEVARAIPVDRSRSL